MGPKNFSIVLDNQQSCYYAGQTVTGRTEFTLTDDLKLTAIIVHFIGKAEVHWSERRGNNTYYYHGAEKYFDTKATILSKEIGSDKMILKPGHHSYPFQCLLPADIPSSYESPIGQVRYSIKATLDRPWAFDNHCKKLFTVVKLLDLNNYPETMAGAGNHTEKTLCCCCCKSPPIKATLKLDRCGYVAGEFIPFSAEIDNQSNREMSCSKAALYMETTYYASSKSRKVVRHITELRHPKIPAGGTDSWVGEKVGIPPLPPSFMEGCRLIDVRYYISIVVDPSGIGFDLHCPVEVTIGSIPFKSVAQEHGYNLPAVPTAPPPGAPSGMYSDASAGLEPNIAFPPMRDSAFGTVNTKEDGDKYTSGDDKYAPQYTYYDWNKSGTASQYTVSGL